MRTCLSERCVGYSAPIRRIAFNIIDKKDSKIGFVNEFDCCRGNMWTMCEFHDSNGNGFGDIGWTDKLIYFIIIDVKPGTAEWKGITIIGCVRKAEDRKHWRKHS